MPNLYTSAVKRVLSELAPDEARRMGHCEITPGHIMLGLIRAGEGVAAETLALYRVDLDTARDVVAEEAPGCTSTTRPILPVLSRQSKELLDLALLEARRIGHTYIGTEHILLSLVHRSQDDSEIRQALDRLNIDPRPVRQMVIMKLSGYYGRSHKRRRSRKLTPLGRAVVAMTAAVATGAILRWAWQ